MGLNKSFAAFGCMVVTLYLMSAAATKADSFSTGQFVTYTQSDWAPGGPTGGVATSLLATDYNSVYQGTGGDLIVGVAGTPGQYFLEFDSSAALLDYMPSAGAASALTANEIDPTTTPTGVFGGDVAALKLDVDFNNAGYLQGTSSVLFGGLVLTNFTGSLAGLNGLTVNQFLALSNTCLAGGSCAPGVVNVDGVNLQLGNAFAAGTPDAYADQHLALPSSTTTPVPEPSSMVLLGLGLLCLLGLAKSKL